jgi:light-harvesting protein B-800-850 alpha chain
MNEGRIWLYVNPSVGLPLFFLVWVAGVAFSIHLAILTNTTWFAAFWQGGAPAAEAAPVEAAPAEAAPAEAAK